MADTKLSALTALTSVASGDLFYVVDVSDTTDGPSGTSKKITRSDLASGFAASGANTDITSLGGLTTPLTVAQGGTGAATLTGILLGNGTSAVTALSSTGTGNVVRATSPTITTPSITGDLGLATGANVQVNGADPKRSFYVPAAGMYGATTNGAATGQIETATNKINTKVLDFDGATEEYAWFCIPSPDYWDLSTITVKFHWTAASGSGNVIWGAAALARSDDDALDTALGTAQTVTDTVLTTNDLHTTSATSAITVGGTPAKGDYLFVRVYRDADAAGDTLNAVDARLIGVTVKFGIGQYDDQ